MSQSPSSIPLSILKNLLSSAVQNQFLEINLSNGDVTLRTYFTQLTHYISFVFRSPLEKATKNYKCFITHTFTRQGFTFSGKLPASALPFFNCRRIRPGIKGRRGKDRIMRVYRKSRAPLPGTPIPKPFGYLFGVSLNSLAYIFCW